MVEALSVTFYHAAITTTNGFFDRLSGAYQDYLRASLDQEYTHYTLLVEQGAQPSSASFYFPPATFGFDDFALFLATLDLLENTTIGMYLAAARRCAELELPPLAALLEQIVGVEAEQRVIGREMSGAPPEPRNNLCLERASYRCASQASAALGRFFTPAGAAPYILPSPEQVAAAVGPLRCTRVPPAAPAACGETLAHILDAAATAEALGITFYYQGIAGGFFAQLPSPQQWYLQAALDEERNHLELLLGQGAMPAATSFFFPDDAFDHLPRVLGILDGLEHLCIGAYLAAAQRFVQLGQPLLAQVAGQILGVEAEHRMLGRLMAGQQLPHDLCLERAAYSCIEEVFGALEPFVQGSASFTRPAALPDRAAIDAAVERFGCTPVGTTPSLANLPLVIR
jgi:hypothetical protein